MNDGAMKPSASSTSTSSTVSSSNLAATAAAAASSTSSSSSSSTFANTVLKSTVSYSKALGSATASKANELALRPSTASPTRPASNVHVAFASAAAQSIHSSADSASNAPVVTESTSIPPLLAPIDASSIASPAVTPATKPAVWNSGSIVSKLISSNAPFAAHAASTASLSSAFSSVAAAANVNARRAASSKAGNPDAAKKAPQSNPVSVPSSTASSTPSAPAPAAKAISDEFPSMPKKSISESGSLSLPSFWNRASSQPAAKSSPDAAAVSAIVIAPSSSLDSPEQLLRRNGSTASSASATHQQSSSSASSLNAASAVVASASPPPLQASLLNDALSSPISDPEESSASLLSNKQRKRAQRAANESMLASLEEAQCNEYEALASLYMTDLVLLHSTPSLTRQFTSIPSHLRVNLVPEPLRDREKENHVLIVLDVVYARLEWNMPHSNARLPPNISIFMSKGLSATQLASFHELLSSRLQRLFEEDKNHDGVLYSLFEECIIWLKQHNVESVSLYEQTKKREREREILKAQELKTKEAEKKKEEEDRRRTLAREIAEANKKKEQAWRLEQQQQHRHAPIKPLAAASTSSVSTAPPSFSAIVSAAALAPRAIETSKRSTLQQIEPKHPSKAALDKSAYRLQQKSRSQDRAQARRGKELGESKLRVAEEKKHDTDAESSLEEEDEDDDDAVMFSSPLMLGNNGSFFNLKKQNEIELLAQIDRRISTNSRHTDESDDEAEEKDDEESSEDEQDESDVSDDEADRQRHTRKVPTSNASRSFFPSASSTSLARNQFSSSSLVPAASTPNPLLASYSRFRDDFEQLLTLGRGSFGTVYKCRNRVDRLFYAIKVIRLRSNPNLNNKLIRETSTIALLHHINICRYYSSWLEQVDSSANSALRQLPSAFEDEQDWLSSSFTHSSLLGDDDVDEDEEFDEEEESGQEKDEDGAPADGRITRSRRSRRIHAHASSAQQLFIQMEFCSGKTLKSFLSEHSSLSSRELSTCWRFLRQICEACAYFHSKYVLHRDLKPANVLLHDGQVKIADFGLAVLASFPSRFAAPSPTTSNASAANLNQASQLINQVSVSSSPSREHEMVGTIFYRSPEQEMGKDCDEKSDIYSIGVIAFELFSIFGSESERVHALSELRATRRVPVDFMRDPSIGVGERDKASRLIEWLLQATPALRPTAAEILRSDLIPLTTNIDELLSNNLLHLTQRNSAHFPRLLDALFAQANEPLVQFTYEYQAQQKHSASLSSISAFSSSSSSSSLLTLSSRLIFQERCFDALISCFQSHGASRLPTPLMAPKDSDQHELQSVSAVLVMDAQGVLLALPQTLTVHFARFVALSAVSLFSSASASASTWPSNSLSLAGGRSLACELRRYDIQEVYRKNTIGGRPRTLFEADFDIVWSSQSSAGDSDADEENWEREKRVATVAECISVSLDCLARFQYALGPVLLRFSHMALLALVVERMAQRCLHTDLPDLAAHLMALVSRFPVISGSFQRSMLRKQMLAAGQFQVKDMEWFATCVMLRSGCRDLDSLCERIRDLFLGASASTTSSLSYSDSIRILTVESCLSEIRSLFEFLTSLGVADFVLFDLGLNNQTALYSNALAFQALAHVSAFSSSKASLSSSAHTAASLGSSTMSSAALELETVAIGGCYDRLISSFAPPSSKAEQSKMHACGVNIAVDKITAAVIEVHTQSPSQPRVFMPFAPFLTASSLHAFAHSSNASPRGRNPAPSKAHASPHIASIFSSITSSVAPASFFPPPSSSSLYPLVLLFSNRQHLLRERLSLASVFWSNEWPCLCLTPPDLTLTSLFSFVKVHAIRFLILMRRSVLRERGMVEVLDFAEIANERSFDKLLVRLKHADKQSKSSAPLSTTSNAEDKPTPSVERERSEGISLVLASQALAFLKSRLVNVSQSELVSQNPSINNIVPSSASSFAIPAASHISNLHVLIVDLQNKIKREQRASIISAVRRAVSPIASSLNADKEMFAVAVELSIASIRAFTSAFLSSSAHSASFLSNSFASAPHHLSTKSIALKRESSEISMPSDMNEKLVAFNFPAKVRASLDELYKMMLKRLLEQSQQHQSKYTFCIIYSLLESKFDLLSLA